MPPAVGSKKHKTTKGDRKRPARHSDAAAKATKTGGIAYEPISVTVPRRIVHEAKSRHPRGEFSEFVARAMARELVREAQEAYLEQAEKVTPSNDAVYREFLSLLSA
ncbi:MAG TPA: hypothetical protein VFB22_05675 [Candidatus Baltobacteraceae bacterium]|nr:hypothetical protein [Candidatus Baltobacteraceae bacterium]